MSYSPSDRCSQCGRYQDCNCEPDIDACGGCGHAVDQHDNDGCHAVHPDFIGLSCSCTANPQPYDPADD